MSEKHQAIRSAQRVARSVRRGRALRRSSAAEVVPSSATRVERQIDLLRLAAVSLFVPVIPAVFLAGAATAADVTDVTYSGFFVASARRIGFNAIRIANRTKTPRP